jgi:steroid 5-alpha reductase family enzyme
MFDVSSWLMALAALVLFAGAGWAASLPIRNVSIVDIQWSLMFVIAGATYALTSAAPLTARALVVLLLAGVWALRLAVHIAWRNRGQGEDFRYRQIRDRNGPGFEWKSLYLVFGLQAVLAWVISLPLLGAVGSEQPLGWLDAAGVALWLAGFVFEAGGDWQLAKFKADPANRGRVMDRGLWRFTRHPNYFGDFCVWWGFGLIALSAGAWWSLVGPALMSVLLLRVSGVALLERDIGERRPGYREYVRRTNAFFPGPPRPGAAVAASVVVGLVAVMAWPHPTLAASSPPERLAFDVFLNDRPIGSQQFELSRTSGGLRVESRAEFEVRVLGIKAFAYDHRNVEYWRGECLERIDSRTNSNGKLFQVSGGAAGESFAVRADGIERKLDPCVAGFAYWDKQRLLARGRLLNPQTGEHVPVDTRSLGRGVVRIGQRNVAVERYALRGPQLDIEVAYEVGSDEWVALDTRVEGGRVLRYRRSESSPPAAAQVRPGSSPGGA